MAHPEKQKMVKEVSTSFRNATGIIVTNFSKMSVVDINALRRKLEKKSSQLIVTKNTLLKRAFAESAHEGVGEFVGEQTGVAVCTADPVPVAKTLFEFSKDHENFKVRGAIVDGALVGEKETKQLSELPSKDVLRAMVVMRLNSPISGLVNVLNGPLRGIAAVLGQIRKQKDENKG